MAYSKYSAKPTFVDGVRFPSKAEARRFGQLVLLQKAGKISGLELQPEFPIFINGVKCFVYRADFSYLENGSRVIEDVKSKPTKTPLYRVKKKCVEAYYDVNIREVAA